MPRYNLIATSAFGLEAVVASELRELGFTDLKTENGKVLFTGDNTDIVRCNLWLRCADRILVRMAEFKLMILKIFMMAMHIIRIHGPLVAILIKIKMIQTMMVLKIMQIIIHSIQINNLNRRAYRQFLVTIKFISTLILMETRPPVSRIREHLD